MGFEFQKKQMTIPEILDGTDRTIIANIDLLAKIYLEKTGRKVCRSCPSDVQFMILSLKDIYKMTQFRFKRHAAMYKDRKGDKATISNATMTDEKAVKFLQTNPERIRLFAEYPSNWETMLFSNGHEETEANKELRLAAEAEAKVVANSDLKPSRDELEKMSLKELRAMFPKVKATSIKAFLDKVFA